MHVGFILFWAFEIPWLSMTFSMTSSSFPWPKFDQFLGNHLSFWVCFYHFLCKKAKFYFALFNKFNIIFHDFPWSTLSRPGKWNSKIPWLFRFSMTHANPLKYYPNRKHVMSNLLIWCGWRLKVWAKGIYLSFFFWLKKQLHASHNEVIPADDFVPAMKVKAQAALVNQLSYSKEKNIDNISPWAKKCWKNQ